MASRTKFEIPIDNTVATTATVVRLPYAGVPLTSFKVNLNKSPSQAHKWTPVTSDNIEDKKPASDSITQIVVKAYAGIPISLFKAKKHIDVLDESAFESKKSESELIAQGLFRSSSPIDPELITPIESACKQAQQLATEHGKTISQFNVIRVPSLSNLILRSTDMSSTEANIFSFDIEDAEELSCTLKKSV